MKTNIFGWWKRFRRSDTFRRSALALVLVMAGWLNAPLSAQTNVTTIGGGSGSTYPGPYSGYLDGQYTRFSQPSGLAMDPAGNYLFVADYSNNVVRFVSSPGSSGRMTYTFTNSANLNITRGITNPIAVAVDLATNVFVLNRGGGTNATGGSLLQFNINYLGFPTLVVTNVPRLTNAAAMAVDGLGNVFVVVQSNTVLRVTPPNAISVVGVITNRGVNLQGIAVMDNDQLALSDAGTNSGIWLMNTYGTNISNNVTKLAGFNGLGDNPDVWPVPATNAIFNRPANIAKAGNGILVIADNNNHRVKLLNTISSTVTLLYGVKTNLWLTGQTIVLSGGATYRDPGGWVDGLAGILQGNAESRLPFGVVVSPDGSVYVAEDYTHVLRHITGAGLSAPVPGYPRSGVAGIGLDPTGNNLYIAAPLNNQVRLLNISSNLTTTFLTAADDLNNPVSVLTDTNGGYDGVYYIDVLNSGTNGYILQFESTTGYGGTNYPYYPLITGLNQPTAFTLDGNGNLFITEQGGAIKVVIASTGTSNTVATITNAGVSLQGIAILDNGNIAVSDAGNHVIWSVNPITKLYHILTGQLGISGTSLGTTNSAKLNQPHQLARSGSQLLVADSGNNRLVLVTASGTTSANLNPNNATLWFGNVNDPVLSTGPTSSRFLSMNDPIGLAVSPAGIIYDSEPTNQDIRGLTASISPPPAIPDVILPFFNSPAGIALNSSGSLLFIADYNNNVIEELNLANNQTIDYLDSSRGILNPVDVALDGSDNLYVLNQGTGGNGSILKFDIFGNTILTNAAGLANPTAMTFDTSGNILVTELKGAVQMFSAGGSNTIATVTNAGVQLQGIAIFNDGTLAVSDAGNHVIWQINPLSKAVSLFTGQINSPGTNFGPTNLAKLNQPHRIAHATGDLLVTADSGNNRIVIVNRSGAITNSLNSTNATVWFGVTGDPYANSSPQFVPMVSPVGVAIGTGGGVFTSETYYNNIRELLTTGLSLPGGGGGGGSGTNIVVLPPIMTPNSGYYPMGQTILVNSTVPEVFYTTDGTDPTTNSTPVSITGNIGYIHWYSSTNDLTSLRVKSFLNGTNSSVTVSGQPAFYGTIGVPQYYTTNSSDFTAANTTLPAGIGSTVVIPVICNLATNEQIQSYQFRLEIAPLNNVNTPVILPLSIYPTNDFVPLVTAAQGGSMASNTFATYTLGVTNGLVDFALGNGTHTLFHNYAVIALLEVQIPYTASEGDTYALNVLWPSATSDGYNTPVSLTSMPPMTILVTNIPYTVGDSASTFNTWYNAGTFGDSNLDNSDVNQAFDAASGMRLPYSFSDVFNAMDAYPPDTTGLAGGDGQIRFLDWITILNRSLRLDTNNWSREWSAGGNLINSTTSLVVSHALSGPTAKSLIQTNSPWPWYRQVLLGAVSVGNASPNSTVYVPVYAKLAEGSSLSGLQFRAVVTPQNGAPALTTAPQLMPASGVNSPLLTHSFKAGETAFGWELGSFNYASRSSNFLGWISFNVPTNAATGHSYQVMLLNADGAPSPTNQYDFETRSATVAVNTTAPSTSICSDEWKIHFFGSTTNPAAADNADPDGDGIPNWMEFLAGTDPTNPQSKLQLATPAITARKGQSQVSINWLTAPGRAYALQWNSNLIGGTWNTLATVSGSGSVTNYPDLNPTVSTRYYRLFVLP